MGNMVQGRVMVVMMLFTGVVFLVLVSLLRAVYQHMDMGSSDTAFFGGFPLVANSRQAKGIQFFYTGIRILQKINQGTCQHITGGTHGAVKIK